MLSVQNITKQFDDTRILKGVSLEVEAGEIVCLLGSSGCGKTTLLRIIAGLESANSGMVTLDGDDLAKQAVHRRNFGLMFQDFALFPHMNVAQNVRFGLDMQGGGDKNQRVLEVLERVRLAGFEKRAVSGLSGGEQQRVALARSLAPQPRLLMLDEPLGSLDAALRDLLAIELREVIKAAGVTAIYVTHDQSEAFAIADRIAVMNAGRIEQISPPDALYLQPETRFVAQFLGLNNFVAIDRVQDDHAQTPLGTFEIDKPDADVLLLHPAFATLVDDGGIPMEVVGRVFRGSHAQITLRHPSDIAISLSVPSVAMPAIGNRVQLQVAEQGIIPL